MRSSVAWAGVPILFLLSLSLCCVPSHSALVQWLPLQGSYVNYANSSAAPVPHGSTSCYGFQSVGGVQAWTQTCGAGSSSATLSMAAYPGEVGDFTVAFYVYVQSFPQETVFFLSCNSFTSGGVDCAEVYYDSMYGILVTRINENGAGNGQGFKLNTQTWTHMAVTYSASSQQLLVYVQGAVVITLTAPHLASKYGAPAIAGEGDSNSANPVKASFINFRQYTTVLTQSQIAAIATTDAPGYVGGSTAMAGGGGAPSPTSAVKTATSAPVVTPTSAAVVGGGTTPVSTPGLMQYLPLQGSYVNSANASAVPTFHGSSSCYGFQTVTPGVQAWTQTCGAGSNPGTLAMAAYPGEQGDFSVTFYIYIQAFPQETVFFLSCNSFASGATDCAEVYYDSMYGILVTRINENGAGNGLGYHISAQTWTHMAVTYSASSQQLLVYVQGAVAVTLQAPHLASKYGSPAIGGEGDSNSGNPVQASYINLRQYNYVLTQSQVQSLQTTDYPLYGGAQPTLTPSPTSAAPTPTSAPKPTSAPVHPHLRTQAGHFRPCGHPHLHCCGHSRHAAGPRAVPAPAGLVRQRGQRVRRAHVPRLVVVLRLPDGHPGGAGLDADVRRGLQPGDAGHGGLPRRAGRLQRHLLHLHPGVPSGDGVLPVVQLVRQWRDGLRGGVLRLDVRHLGDAHQRERGGQRAGLSHLRTDVDAHGRDLLCILPAAAGVRAGCGGRDSAGSSPGVQVRLACHRR